MSQLTVISNRKVTTQGEATTKLRVLGLTVLLCLVTAQQQRINIAGCEPDSYRNHALSGVFHSQDTSKSCASACVQMVLQYYQISPLPTQEVLAEEMNTTIEKQTEAYIVYVPFEKRDIDIVFDGHFSLNFSRSCEQLKGNVSLDRPIIVLMYYNSSKSMGHYRVVTGYNQTGFFCSDPSKGGQYTGTNVYFEDELFAALWTRHRNWGLVLENQPPSSEPSNPILEFFNWIVEALWKFLSSLWPWS